VLSNVRTKPGAAKAVHSTALHDAAANDERDFDVLPLGQMRGEDLNSTPKHAANAPNDRHRPLELAFPNPANTPPFRPQKPQEVPWGKQNPACPATAGVAAILRYRARETT
jgi:hypothetical protein